MVSIFFFGYVRFMMASEVAVVECKTFHYVKYSFSLHFAVTLLTQFYEILFYKDQKKYIIKRVSNVFAYTICAIYFGFEE